MFFAQAAPRLACNQQLQHEMVAAITNIGVAMLLHTSMIFISFLAPSLSIAPVKVQEN